MLKDFFNVSLLVTLGKVLGFVKQSVIAYYFGVSSLVDIFFIADSFTSFIGRVLNQGIVQSITSCKISEEKRKEFFANIGIIFIFAGIIITILMVCCSSKIAHILCKNENFTDITCVSNILIILSFVIVFSCIIGVNQGVLERNKNFIPGQLFSFIFSLSIITSIFFLKDKLNIYALSVGFVGGYVIYSLFLMYSGANHIRWSKVNLKFNADYSIFFKKSCGIIGIASVAEVCYLCDMLIAASVPNSNVSTLYYSQVISVNVINGIVVTALSTVMFPTFFSTVLKGNAETISSLLKKILIIDIYIIALITVIYLSCGYEIVKIFFERGSFTNENTKSVALLTYLYSIGFMFSSVRIITLRMHLAFQDVKTALLNSLHGAVLNIMLSYILAKIYGITGIVVATGITMFCMMIRSLISLNRHIKFIDTNYRFFLEIAKIYLCCIMSSIVTIMLSNNLYFKGGFMDALLKCVSGLLFFILFSMTINRNNTIKLLTDIKSIIKGAKL